MTQTTKTVIKTYSVGNLTKNMVRYEEDGVKGERLLPTPYMSKETIRKEFGSIPIGFRVTFEPIFS